MIKTGCTLTLWILLLAFSLRSAAQGRKDNTDTTLLSKVIQAERYLNSFKNDSAIVMLKEVLGNLDADSEATSNLSIRARLAYGTALERDQQDEAAIEELLAVRELSAANGAWEAYAKSCLALANLYEKIDRAESCKEVLEDARKAITTYRLDAIYPFFAVRLSSYHRIYADIDSARFYAREVLRTAPQFDLTLETAIGNLLMGLLMYDSSFEASRDYFLRAAGLYLELEDYTGYSYTMGNTARAYLEEGNLPLAMLYNDSMIVAAFAWDMRSTLLSGGRIAPRGRSTGRRDFLIRPGRISPRDMNGSSILCRKTMRKRSWRSTPDTTMS